MARADDSAAHGARRRAELLALAGTIPAFYMALLGTHRALAVALYLIAGAAAFLVVAIELRGSRTPRRAALMRHRLSLLLALGLMLSAALPPGEALDLLIVRLGTAVLAILRAGESTRPWFWHSALADLLALAIGVLGLCGLGFWWLEPRAHSFGDGLWLAFTTAATVGYGDIVPSTPASKIFTAFVVLMGFAVLSLVTAAIAAMWVQTEERKIEHEIQRDLHLQLRGLREEVSALRREIREHHAAE